MREMSEWLARSHDGVCARCHDKLTRGMIDKDGPPLVNRRHALSQRCVLALDGKRVAEQPIERVCPGDVGGKARTGRL